MKKLTHEEWQSIVTKEFELLQEHLNGVTSTEEYLAKIDQLEKLREGKSQCHDCTLGRSLPHSVR